MNPPRIELGYPRCKRGVLPLDYGFVILGRGFLFLKLVICLFFSYFVSDILLNDGVYLIV
jgi:hypothetical protein